MSAHDVNDDRPAKLGEIVRADDRVDRAVLAKPCLVCLGFVLQQSLNPQFSFQSPFHMGDKSNEVKSLMPSVPPDLLEQSERPALIEVAIAQMRISPVTELELATPV